MDATVEDRVYAFLAKERGVKRSKLFASTALSYDLGLEGDDAVEFFENFENEFSVDLKPLGEDWDRYFAPEGVPLSAGLLVVGPGICISILLANAFPHLPSWVSFSLGFLFWLVVLFGWMRFRGKRYPQITIHDLIECANTGKWTKTLTQGTEQSGLAPRTAR